VRTLHLVPTVHGMLETPEANPADIPDADSTAGAEVIYELMVISTCWHRILGAIAQRAQQGEYRMRDLRVFSDGMPYPIRRLYLPKKPDRLTEPTVHAVWALRKGGAKLCGTESLALMGKHARLIERRHRGKRVRRSAEQAIIRARDAFIAQRISDDIPDGGTGVLFIGFGHRVHHALARTAPDIRIVPDESFKAVVDPALWQRLRL
jgi:hypothetical protein